MQRPQHRSHITRVTRLLACGVSFAVLWACGPVYLPVPPPAAVTTIAFTPELLTAPDGNQRQVWTAVGAPHAPADGATHTLFDQQRNAGVITVAASDGSYIAPPMEGTEGDHVIVHYIDTRGERSENACFILSAQQPAATCPP